MKKRINVKDELYFFLFYNKRLKKITGSLLSSAWFVNNPIYQFYLSQFIQKTAAKYKGAPNTVVVENTNLCNSACVICPHSIMKRKQGVMAEGLFKKIIDECACLGVANVNIHNFGEPILDKNFVEKVRYAKAKGIPWIGTSTNGKLLSESLSRKIILSGLDGINFSLDAYSKSAYEKIRIGLPFGKVIGNVKEFIKLRNKLGMSKPLVVVDFVETKFNQGESQKFIEEWKGLADKVNITTLHTWGGSFKGQAGEEKFHFQNFKVKRAPCRFLWTDMIVNWDGRVSACCQDYEAKMVVGNAATQSLKEIWQGKIVNELRKKHLSGQMNNIPLCSKCDYRSVWWLFK